MTAESLFNAAVNNPRAYQSIIGAVGMLQRAIDRTAEQVARDNAAWHDDPAADDHAEYHAPADVQFPAEVRREVIVDLVKHYLAERALNPQ